VAEFNWSSAEDSDAVVVPTQLAIAAYWNGQGAVVIRQEHDHSDDQDDYVVVQRPHLRALINKLIELDESGPE
jgi:hypothetical protein